MCEADEHVASNCSVQLEDPGVAVHTRPQQVRTQGHALARPLSRIKGSANASTTGQLQSLPAAQSSYMPLHNCSQRLASNGCQASCHVSEAGSQYGWVACCVCMRGGSTRACPEAREILSAGVTPPPDTGANYSLAALVETSCVDRLIGCGTVEPPSGHGAEDEPGILR